VKGNGKGGGKKRHRKKKKGKKRELCKLPQFLYYLGKRLPVKRGKRGKKKGELGVKARKKKKTKTSPTTTIDQTPPKKKKEKGA